MCSRLLASCLQSSLLLSPHSIILASLPNSLKPNQNVNHSIWETTELKYIKRHVHTILGLFQPLVLIHWKKLPGREGFGAPCLLRKLATRLGTTVSRLLPSNPSAFCPLLTPSPVLHLSGGETDHEGPRDSSCMLYAPWLWTKPSVHLLMFTYPSSKLRC